MKNYYSTSSSSPLTSLTMQASIFIEWNSLSNWVEMREVNSELDDNVRLYKLAGIIHFFVYFVHAASLSFRYHIFACVFYGIRFFPLLSISQNLINRFFLLSFLALSHFWNCVNFTLCSQHHFAIFFYFSPLKVLLCRWCCWKGIFSVVFRSVLFVWNSKVFPQFLFDVVDVHKFDQCWIEDDFFASFLIYSVKNRKRNFFQLVFFVLALLRALYISFFRLSHKNWI